MPFHRINPNLPVETLDGHGRYPYLIARIVQDHDPDTSYLDQDEFKARKRAYRHHAFEFLGVIVQAYDDSDTEVGHASLWGIESDSDPAYFADIANELAAEVQPADNQDETPVGAGDES